MLSQGQLLLWRMFWDNVWLRALTASENFSWEVSCELCALSAATGHGPRATTPVAGFRATALGRQERTRNEFYLVVFCQRHSSDRILG